MIKGIYSGITAYTHQKEDEKHLAISTDALVEHLTENYREEIESTPKEELIDIVLRQAIAIGLNGLGYRSVLPGEGFYVNPDNCDKPEYWEQFFTNCEMEIMQKQQVYESLLQKRKEKNIPGQLQFDDNMKIIETVSMEKLLEMLKADAGIV